MTDSDDLRRVCASFESCCRCLTLFQSLNRGVPACLVRILASPFAAGQQSREFPVQGAFCASTHGGMMAGNGMGCTRHNPTNAEPVELETERSMIKASEDVERLLPAYPVPEYAFYPGSGLPHPVRDPKGHSYGRKHSIAGQPKALTAENWGENRAFLLGVDYFNLGFYWEAHEEWERLWRISGVDTTIGRFLKGLIKLAAAGVKVRERSIHGVRRHAASAGEMFADVAAEADVDTFCGLEFIRLQFAADRAAQLAYKTEHEPGKAVRVFPFTLKPALTPAT